MSNSTNKGSREDVQGMVAMLVKVCCMIDGSSRRHERPRFL